jgi:hypothetical protein
MVALAINLTHNWSGVTINTQNIRDWFKNFVDRYHDRILAWVEIRLWLVISQSGGVDEWAKNTSQDRCEI